MNAIKYIAFVFILILVGSCVTLIPIKVGSAPDLKVNITPERVTRGEYLARAVTSCIECHSMHNWDLYANPIIEGTEGKGGECYGEELGLPGTICMSNITPYALGHWTDGEIFRALVSGVDNEENAIFPMMPYQHYANMTEEDIYSIIAYLRTMKSIPGEVGDSKLKFPLPYIIRTMPKEYKPQLKPDPNDEVAYGKYLVSIGGCVECHTPMKGHKHIEGMEFAGGSEYKLPGGVIVKSSNITPDKDTGIGDWERDDFIERFKEFATPEARQSAVINNKNTIMGWLFYAEMTEADLGAMYTYLMSLEPINNPVELYP